MDEVRKEVLLEIKTNYSYSSPVKVVSHYMQKISPDPETLNTQGEIFYSEVHSSLENLLIVSNEV